MRCVTVHFLMKIEICKHKLVRPPKKSVFATKNGTKQGRLAHATLADNRYGLWFSGIDTAEYRCQFPGSPKEPTIIFNSSSIQIGIDCIDHETALRFSSSVTCQIECSRAIHVRSRSMRNRYTIDGPR